MSEVYIGVKFECKRLGTLEEYGKTNDKVELLRSIIHRLPKESIMGGAGNVSTRIHSGKNDFIISATGVDLRSITDNDFSVITKVVEPIVEYFGLTPSSESPMHALIYQNYPDINYIIHTHPVNIVHISKVSNYPITSMVYAYGTFEAGRAVVELLKGQNLVVLRDHGIVLVENNEKTNHPLVFSV
ncbi:MAG: class II aldolase/adducin family protein [Candidatus Kariarchaeaceae archaeon]|jgi:ribulose-5-phosphate 4-epimerase/fuculose-1-phosphate aldolase